MYQPFSLDECQRKSNLMTHWDPTHSLVSSGFHVKELLEHFSIIIIYVVKHLENFSLFLFVMIEVLIS